MILVVLFVACLVDVNGDSSLHPMLYFTSADVASLRSKSTTTHAPIFARLKVLVDRVKASPTTLLAPTDWKKFGSRWNEEYGNRLAPCAFYALLRPNDKKIEEHVIKAMDNMAAYPDWKVAPSPLDEVPICHSLIGFVSAYDFIYDRLDDKRRKIYMDKIVHVTAEIYDRARKAWWGHSYVQNHVATNTIALLTSAILVVKTTTKHAGVATTWRNFAAAHFRRTIEVLNLVVDGSMDEGTGYGSYTTRSLTQYVFLMQRHMGVNLTGEFWLQQYLRFTLGTTLPGRREIIGIGDSGATWFYGPESQLVFLDAFVLRNGYANWLASRVRQWRLDVATSSAANAMGESTLHTEYVWYDASVPERSPLSDFDSLQRFSDAGLVTYNGAADADKTFFSFKSGPLHGRGVYVAVENHTFPWLTSWRGSLNPGHEHPDQNSFVFYPRGKPFVTEALYGPKFTFLNNALTFRPSRATKCRAPDEGQLGECGKWLDWKSPGMERAWADVVTASRRDGMVFVAGEAARAYHSHLKLKSVYRATYLLCDDVLLVVDHVETKPDSQLESMNAYFHNRQAPFRIVDRRRRATLNLDDETYYVDWVTANEEESSANGTTGLYDQPRGGGFIRTHFLNISFELDFPRTRVAYLFRGAGAPDVRRFSLIVDSSIGVTVVVDFVGRQSYRAKLVTDYRSVQHRLDYMGFLGYGSVDVIDIESVKFGIELNVTETRENKRATSRLGDGNVMMMISLLLAVIIMTGVALFYFKRKAKVDVHCFVVFIFLFCFVSLPLYLYQTRHASSAMERLKVPTSRSPLVPALFVASLPNAGVDLVAALVTNETDIFHVRLGSSPLGDADVVYLKDGYSEACEWSRDHPRIGDWFRAYFTRPESLFKSTARQTAEWKALKALRWEHPGSIVALLSDGQNMNLKLPWIVNRTGSILHAIFFVRDPRAWVASTMKSAVDVESKLKSMFESLHSHCNVGTGYPTEYKSLEESFRDGKKLAAHELLATLWKANTEAALRINAALPSSNYRLYRFEDLMREPVRIATAIYNFVGLPLPLAAEHRILQATRSDVFNPPRVDAWRKDLGANAIADVERICEKTMRKLGYSRTPLSDHLS